MKFLSVLVPFLLHAIVATTVAFQPEHLLHAFRLLGEGLEALDAAAKFVAPTAAASELSDQAGPSPPPRPRFPPAFTVPITLMQSKMSGIPFSFNQTVLPGSAYSRADNDDFAASESRSFVATPALGPDFVAEQIMVMRSNKKPAPTGVGLAAAGASVSISKSEDEDRNNGRPSAFYPDFMGYVSGSDPERATCLDITPAIPGGKVPAASADQFHWLKYSTFVGMKVLNDNRKCAEWKFSIDKPVKYKVAACFWEVPRLPSGEQLLGGAAEGGTRCPRWGPAVSTMEYAGGPAGDAVSTMGHAFFSKVTFVPSPPLPRIFPCNPPTHL